MHGNSRQAKFITLATVLLVVLFWIFFNLSKHNPALVKVNVFDEDPYDAVGSFGIQLAILSSMLSFLRILRPYSNGIASENLLLILRGDAVALLSVLVTMAANLIALSRYLPEWTGSPAGWILASAAGSLLILAALSIWMIIHLGRTLHFLTGARAWSKSLFICLLGLVIIAFYPETWRQSAPGAIFTALTGMLLLFVLVSAIVKLIFPPSGEVSEDFLDDLLALFQWLKIRAVFARFFFDWIAKMTYIPWARKLLNWLNPRKHAWNAVFLLGLALALALLLIEAVGEGAPDQSHILLVIGIYIGLECAGVLLGYVLFKQYLGIIRS